MAIERKQFIAEWIWRLLVVAMLVGSFYLKSSFVTKDAYDADKKALDKLMADMMLIIKTDEVRAQITERQGEELRDHESRLRVIEMKR